MWFCSHDLLVAYLNGALPPLYKGKNRDSELVLAKSQYPEDLWFRQYALIWNK